MFSLVQLAAFLVVIQGAYALKCIGLVPRENGTVMMVTLDSTVLGIDCNSSAECACASYRGQCSDNNTACTVIEIELKIVKWFYIITTKDMCTHTMNAPSSPYMNATCCYTDMCNNQGLSDPLLCYTMVYDSNYTTVIETLNGVMAGIYCDVLGGCVCASYRAECKSYKLECTESEVKAKTVKWFYKITSKTLCTTLMNTPSEYKDVTCCDTDLCNNQGMGNTASTVVHSFSAWTTLLILYIAFKQT